MTYDLRRFHNLFDLNLTLPRHPTGLDMSGEGIAVLGNIFAARVWTYEGAGCSAELDMVFERWPFPEYFPAVRTGHRVPSGPCGRTTKKESGVSSRNSTK